MKKLFTYLTPSVKVIEIHTDSFICVTSPIGDSGGGIGDIDDGDDFS